MGLFSREAGGGERAGGEADVTKMDVCAGQEGGELGERGPGWECERAQSQTSVKRKSCWKPQPAVVGVEEVSSDS